MAHTFRNTLTLLLLTAILATPAVARTVIGVTPVIAPGAGDPAVTGAFERELSSRLGDTVQVRSFGSEAAVLDWLIRFRELDAALVEPGLVHTLPAGTLLHLADLPQAAVVTYPGQAAASLDRLRQAFLDVLGDKHGRLLLNRLTGAAKVPSPAKGVPAKPAAPPVAIPAAGASSALKPTVSVASSPPLPTSGGVPEPAVVPNGPALPPPQSAASLPSLKATAPLTVAQTPDKPVATAAPVKPQPTIPAPDAKPPVEPSSSKRTPLLLTAALVVLFGIGTKIVLLMCRWQQKWVTSNVPRQPPSAESFHYQGMFASGPETAPKIAPPPSPVSPPAPAPAITVSTPAKRSAPKRKPAPPKAGKDIFPPIDNELIMERGRLGRIKAPALLKRCAELPRPAVLRVRAGDSETSVHFAGGQICHALSCNWRIDAGTRRWHKLGYLMVRDGLISETQRDQALGLIERQPKLRFLDALRQLGILDLEALRHILARQAKATIYTLILFSSGEYRIEADSGIIPTEESLALQVEALLREASHHQAEWTAIRKVLPNLATLLDFAPDGHEKLEQVRLSIHQQRLLSQVDGQASIGALCGGSTMMDYEACRFLYLMVKAGVLQTITTSR